MNNLKKIGLTALAASLVSVSAHAGEMSVSGGASLTASGSSGEGNDAGTSFTMGNQLTFTGGGELDNGMNVAISFVIDQGDDATAGGTAPFDSHSLTLSSDAMGTLKFSGEGGVSTVSAIGTAAGDLWDAFDQDDFSTVDGTAVIGDLLSTNGGGDDSFYYTAPEVMDGLTLNASYNPASTDHRESELGYGVSYAGIEGLTLKYATQDVVAATEALSGDQQVYMASYAIGSFTVAATYHDLDITNSSTTVSTDQKATAYKVSYTVSDDLSISYGVEEHDQAANTETAHANPELDRISVAYTMGGMTISGSMTNGDNLTRTTATRGDQEEWSLGASFAF